LYLGFIPISKRNTKEYGRIDLAEKRKKLKEVLFGPSLLLMIRQVHLGRPLRIESNVCPVPFIGMDWESGL
jgi:hypothetical protein